MRPSSPAANESKPPPPKLTPAANVALDIPSTRLSISHSHPTSLARARNSETPQFAAVLDAVHARRVGPEDLPLPGRGHILHVLHQLVDDAGILGIGVREVAGP